MTYVMKGEGVARQLCGYKHFHKSLMISLNPHFKKKQMKMGGRDRGAAWSTEHCRNVKKLYLSKVERINS